MIGSRAKWQYPPYSPSFLLGDGYSFGLDVARRIEETINGGAGCLPEDSALLAEIALRAGSSDHLELGTLFGSTAIVVAATKKAFDLDGDVYCIDNFSYLSGKFQVGPEVVMENAKLFDVADRIKVLVGDTYPLPPDITERHFGSAYIDAAHDYGNCRQDWYSVKDISDVVVFHDYDLSHMGVVSTVRNAMQEPGWWLVHLSHHTAIMERLE
jgi:predicted O-methyltransferase YrrM